MEVCFPLLFAVRSAIKLNFVRLEKIQLILKGQYHCNHVNLKCKLLLNHAIYRKPGQNRTKNKRVTYMYIVENKKP